MRCAILADVHGNDDALSAVLRDIELVRLEHGAAMDQIWCLGDVIGYGPEPGECVRRIRSSCDICIAGNHDWAAIGKIDLADFSQGAAASAQWTRDQLNLDEQIYLRLLPDMTQVGDFTLAHGSPSNPVWEYLTTPTAAAANFSAFDTLFCVVGHTHLPTIFLQPLSTSPAVSTPVRRAMSTTVALAMATPGGPSRYALEGEEVTNTAAESLATTCTRVIPSSGLWMLPAGYRAIINPGSVGQPRDGDARASYLIYDSQVGFEFRRVAYNIDATRKKIQAKGLPEQLATRLAKGI